MKKQLILGFLLLLSLSLVGCRDARTFNDKVNVVFFTSNSDPNKLEAYLNIDANSLIEEPEFIPTRLGYDFLGWFKDINATQPWDFTTDRIGNESIVLYAGWGSLIFNIFYDWNGGTIPTTPYQTTFKVGQSFVLPQPRKTGYEFKAWYLYDENEWVGYTPGIGQTYKPGDGGYSTLPSNVGAADLYLYAHWDAIRVSVTFRANYPGTQTVSNPSSRTFTYDYQLINDANYEASMTEVNRLPDFSAIQSTLDYTFIGWNSSVDGTGTWYLENTPFQRTIRITLYAQWQAK